MRQSSVSVSHALHALFSPAPVETERQNLVRARGLIALCARVCARKGAIEAVLCSRIVMRAPNLVQSIFERRSWRRDSQAFISVAITTGKLQVIRLVIRAVLLRLEANVQKRAA
eukprot:6182364-Pleurochrysis_carterae.AAC.2